MQKCGILVGNCLGSLTQLARVSRLHRGSRGFESLATHHILICV